MTLKMVESGVHVNRGTIWDSVLRFGKEEVLREVCVTYSYEYEKNKRDTSGEDFNDGCSRSATHIIRVTLLNSSFLQDPKVKTVL